MIKLPSQDKAPAFLAGISKANSDLNDIANGLTSYIEKNGIEVYGNPSPTFLRSIVNGHQQNAESIRSFLSYAGVRVGVGCLTQDVAPEITKHTHMPTPDDSRTHYNQTSGVYFGATNLVCVTEKSWRINPLPSQLLDGTADPILENAQLSRKTYFHEIGHALYNNLPPELFNKEAFLETYRLNVEALGGSDAARKKGFGYFIQDKKPGRGPDETFAESYAIMMVEKNPVYFPPDPVPPPLPPDIAGPDEPLLSPPKADLPLPPPSEPYRRKFETNDWMEHWGLCSAFVRQFVEAFDVTWKNEQALFALKKGRSDIIRDYLDKGGDVNVKDREGNPLITRAIGDQNDEVVGMLLQHPKIDINATDEYGRDVLSVATAHEDMHTIKAILERQDIRDIEPALKIASEHVKNDQSCGLWNSGASHIVSRLVSYKEKQVNNNASLSPTQNSENTIAESSQSAHTAIQQPAEISMSASAPPLMQTLHRRRNYEELKFRSITPGDAVPNVPSTPRKVARNRYSLIV